jgi:phosphoribosylformylglycinamidine synthase I
MKPTVLILRTAGTNCDGETAHAFALAGATPNLVHVNRLLERPAILHEHQILALPGGFSYGDDIAAGRILANQLMHRLRDQLHAFVAAGKPVIGICNGFQVLVKTDLLPGPLGGRTGQTATLAHNASGRFTDRWIETRGLAPMELPIAHGEGRFVPADDAVRRALHDAGHVALVYDNATNPNGSVDDIAGVCDATGLVFGLMPHPERYVDPTQHYAWTSQSPRPAVGAGLKVFENAVRHAAA